MENNFRLALTILVSLMIMCIIENSMSRKIKKNISIKEQKNNMKNMVNYHGKNVRDEIIKMKNFINNRKSNIKVIKILD